MPRYSHSLSLSQETSSDAIVLSYGAFLQMGWVAEHSTESSLIGYVKTSWGAPGGTIIVDVADGVLKVTSKLPESSALDIPTTNKNNVTEFLDAYQSVNASYDKEKIDQWHKALYQLQADTNQAIHDEQKDLNEVDAFK